MPPTQGLWIPSIYWQLVSGATTVCYPRHTYVTIEVDHTDRAPMVVGRTQRRQRGCVITAERNDARSRVLARIGALGGDYLQIDRSELMLRQKLSPPVFTYLVGFV